MVISATLVLLAFWLAVVWHFDIDGFRESRRKFSTADRDDRDATANR